MYPIFNNHVADYARVLLHDDIHLHLKHVLSHLGTKWHPHELESPSVAVECYQFVSCFCEGHLEKVFKLSTLVYTVYCLWFVTLSNDCSVQATRTQMEMHCMINIGLI